MERDERHDEQNTSSTHSLADTVTSHTRWARSIVSPWVQRRFDRTRRSGSAGVSASYTLDRLQRVHHRAYEANAWRPDVGSVSPASLEQFAGTIIRRHRSFEAKATQRISHPQSQEDTSSSLPLAHPGGVRVAAEESDGHRSPVSPPSRSSPSMPAQPQPPPQSPGRPSPSPQRPSSQASESSSMPPLPSNHPLNTGDAPIKRVQRQTQPSRSVSESPAQPQQSPKRRRIYSRVEEITPGGAMTDDAASDDSLSEPASPAEQPVQEDDEPAPSTAREAGSDESPTTDSVEDSSETVQRTARDETSTSPAQPEPADASAPTSLRRRDRQQSTPSTQTGDTSTVQRTPDDSEKTTPSSSKPQPDDVAPSSSESQRDDVSFRSEEPSTTEQSAGDAAASNDIQRQTESAQQDTARAVPPTDDEIQVSEEPRTTDQTPEDVHVTDNIQREKKSSQQDVTPAVPQADEEMQAPEEPPTEAPAADMAVPDTTKTDIEASEPTAASSPESGEPSSVREKRSPDESQHVRTSASPPETQSPQEASDGTVQRRAQQSESAEAKPAASSQASETDTDISLDTVRPTQDHLDTPADTDQVEAPASPTEAKPETVQRTPDDASTPDAPKNIREDSPRDEQPPAPSTEPSVFDQVEDQTEQFDVSESPVTHSTGAGSEPSSGDDVVQRTWDTPETQPVQQPEAIQHLEEPVDGPERSPSTDDVTTDDSGGAPADTSSSESEATLHRRESNDSEPTGQPAIESATGELAADEPHIQRAPEDDIDLEAAMSTGQQQQTKNPAERERPAEPDGPDAKEASPAPSSAKPEQPAETAPATDESSHVQRQRQGDPESPAREEPTSSESDAGVETSPAPPATSTGDDAPTLVPRKPGLTDEQSDAGTDTLEYDAPEPDTSDAQSVARPDETPTSTEPVSTHEVDQPIQRTASQERRRPATEPADDTTIRRDPKRDASDGTVVQRQTDTSRDGPDTRAAEQPATTGAQSDDTPARVPDDTTSTEPIQRTALDEPTVAEDLPQPSDDAPAPAEESTIRRPEAEQIGDTLESSSESANVQRTPDDSTTAPTSDVGDTQDATLKSDTASNPTELTQQEMPASDESGPTEQLPEPVEQTDVASAHNVPSADTQLPAQIQRTPDDSEPAVVDPGPAQPADAGAKPAPETTSGTATRPDDTPPQAQMQRRPDDARSTGKTDAMPLGEPDATPPAILEQSDPSAESTFRREPDSDTSAPPTTPAAHEPEARPDSASTPADRSPAPSDPRDRRTVRAQESSDTDAVLHQAAGTERDTQHEVRRVPVADRTTTPEQPPIGGLEQAILSRAESHSRLPLAARNTIRRKPAKPSDDPGVSQPTQTLRRIHSQIQSRSPVAGERAIRDVERMRTQQQLPDPPMPGPSKVTEPQSGSALETAEEREVTPAPEVTPPVFTSAARTSDTTLIQRKPLELVQRVPPSAGSEARQESAPEPAPDREVEETDDDSEINLERLARDVYPLIKRMIAIERERRPGR